MKVFLFLFLAFGCIAIPSGFSQRVIVLKSGQSIVFKNDGSFEKYIDTTSIVTPLDSASQKDITDRDTPLLKAATAVLEKAESKEVDQYILLETLEKELSARQLKVTQSITLNNKQEEANANKDVDDIKGKIKILNKLYHNSSEVVVECQNLISDKNGINNKKLKQLANDMDVDIKPYLDEESNPKLLANDVKENEKEQKEAKKIKESICKITLNKDKSITSEYVPFYTYTPDKLKIHFKENDLMKTSVSVQKIKKTYVIHFKIDITSKQAAKNYGVINKGSLMKINLLNEKYLNLKATHEVVGYIEAYSGHYIYEVQYILDKESLKSLEKHPIDKMGIIWSSGFEVYDIYNVDAISRLLSCIKSY